MMIEYTETFAAFILEAREAYNEVCEKIERGLVPAGHSATVQITLTPTTVNAVRSERLAIMAAENGNGNGDG